MTWSAGLAPEIVYGLIPRFVGVLYVLGFGGLIFQHNEIGGSGLFASGQEMMKRARRDFGARRLVEFPSVLWFGGGPAMMRVIPFVGVLAGLCAIMGGPLGYCALVLAWVLWLSIEPYGIMFPWDTMLQEMGFLVLFLPAVPLLPEITASALPLPSVAFMVRWLVLRLMLGFAKEKFIGTRKSDRLYLRGFFVWMPLPTPLGWLAHHLPAKVLHAMLLFMFVAEVVAPLLGLFSGDLRLVSFAMLVGLMVGIHATGNWGYFNVGYALLCISLLDVNASIFDLGREPWVHTLTSWPDVAVHALMGAMFLVSLFYLPNNSFLMRTWLSWPPTMFALPHRWIPLAKRVHRMFTPLRAIWGLRIVNGYGVFPPHAMPPIRLIPVVEGSDDGTTWKQYGYKFMPSFPDSKPPVIAPFHARFDQYAYYVMMGVDTGSLIGSLYPYAHPYGAWTYSTAFDQLVQRLLEDDPRARSIFGHNPFPNAAPKLIRVGVIGMTPTRVAEMRATGHWWHVRRIGTVLPARGRESWPDKLFVPEPETFHPDFVAWRKRAKPLRAIVQALRSGVPFDEAAITGSELTRADVEQFWNELVPLLARERGDWSQIHQRRAALSERFGQADLFRLERVLERFVWLLRDRTEAYHYAEAQPALPVMSNFRYHMFLHDCVIDGREAYAALLAEPARAAARAQSSTDATQFWTLGLMRYERVMQNNYMLRASEMGVAAAEQGLPGMFEYADLLSKVVPPGEEFCPRFVLHPDGEHTIEGFYPPPPLRVDRTGQKGGVIDPASTNS